MSEVPAVNNVLVPLVVEVFAWSTFSHTNVVVIDRCLRVKLGPGLGMKARRRHKGQQGYKAPPEHGMRAPHSQNDEHLVFLAFTDDSIPTLTLTNNHTSKSSHCLANTTLNTPSSIPNVYLGRLTKNERTSTLEPIGIFKITRTSPLYLPLIRV